MIWSKLGSIALGAILGSWMRWGLTLLLNSVISTLPIGTLIANLVGSYLAGILLASASAHDLMTETTLLFIGTGFLGSLTTFSTFSAETVSLLERGEYLSGFFVALVHVIGSLSLTFAGLATGRIIWSN